MAVQSVQLSSTGFIPNTTGLGNNLQQQLPEFILIQTNDTLATVTTAGYLNHSKTYFQFPYNNGQMALVYTTDGTGQTQWLSVSVSGSTYSLVATTDFATTFLAAVGSASAPSFSFSGHTTTGMYYAATNSVAFTAGGLLSFVVSSTAGATNHIVVSSSATNVANAALQPGFTAVGTDTNIDVSAAGKGAGGLAVLPSSTAAAGHLKLWNGAGNFYGEIVFAALGQTTVMTAVDVGSAVGRFLVANTATPFTSGNLVQASGTGGLTVDSGITGASVSGAVTQLGQLQQLSVTLTPAQIIAGYAAPVVLIPAVAGKVAIIVQTFIPQALVIHHLQQVLAPSFNMVRQFMGAALLQQVQALWRVILQQQQAKCVQLMRQRVLFILALQILAFILAVQQHLPQAQEQM